MSALWYTTLDKVLDTPISLYHRQDEQDEQGRPLRFLILQIMKILSKVVRNPP